MEPVEPAGIAGVADIAELVAGTGHSVLPALCSANWKPVGSVGWEEATAWELSAAD